MNGLHKEVATALRSLAIQLEQMGHDAEVRVSEELMYWADRLRNGS